MDFDLVVTNGTVIDGTGAPGFRADVGVRDGRIAAVAEHGGLDGAEVLDATDLVVAPGFIDMHTHFDWYLPLPDHDRRLTPLLLQGITTITTGMCGQSVAPVTELSEPILRHRLGSYGIDGGSQKEEQGYFRWHSVAEYLDALEAAGVLFNAALLVGHGTLRYGVMGKHADGADPDREEVGALCSLLREAMDDGAFGLSAGLGYEPGMYARSSELLDLLNVTAAEDGLYAVHSRSYSRISPIYPPGMETPANVLSTREQLELAQKAGVRLQLSHLLFHGRRTWPTYHTVFEDVERAADDGLDVAFDSFPYTFGNTTINVNFPKWFLEELEGHLDDPQALGRLEEELETRNELLGRDYRDIILMYGGAPELKELEGLDFATIGDRLGLSPFDAYMHVARKGQGSARIIQDTYSGDAESEEPLRAVLAHPRCAFMTDTFVFDEGYANRAAYGTYPRILGHYVRDVRLLGLEEAVRRMTSFPASRLGLEETIGRVAEGFAADLVVFDARNVADTSTREQPDATPIGIEAVLVSGRVAARKGQRASAERHGRVLRRQ